jgi:hypothetical protein
MSSCENTDKFNVVILYDHVASVGRAMAAYACLTRELENEITPELRIWRIDIATLPECAAQADDDIRAAEMVIMAVRGNQPCPAGFHRWSEETAGYLGLAQRALIALVDAVDEPARSAGTWHCMIRKIVEQIQLDVFLWTAPAESGGPMLPAQFGGAVQETGIPALEAVPGAAQTL